MFIISYQKAHVQKHNLKKKLLLQAKLCKSSTESAVPVLLGVKVPLDEFAWAG